MKSFLLVFSCTLFFFLAPSLLYGVENQRDRIESISFQENTGEGESLRFKLTGRVIPEIFILGGEKPRLVLDFFETDVAFGIENSIEATGYIVKRIRMGIHNTPVSKTRVAIDLSENGDYKYDTTFLEEENVLLVTLLNNEKRGVEIEVRSDSKQEPQPTISPVPTIPKKKKSATKEVNVKEQEMIVIEEREKGSHATTSSSNKGKDSAIAEKDEGATLKEQLTAEPPSEAQLMNVTFENTSNKGEMVLFKLNGFYPPIVFGIEKGEPRVVCDFLDTGLAEKIASQIPCNGKYVKTVRVTKHSVPAKVRVVLHLVPNKSYDLQQVFFKEDNLFVLIVDNMEDRL